MSRADPPKPAPRPVRPRGRPPIPAQDIARRRRTIIEVAARMFFADGFAATTLDEVGREAGFTKRTIYELVGDKGALFRAACDQLTIENRHLRFERPTPDQPLRDVLTRLARALIDHSLAPDMLASQRAIMMEVRDQPDLVRAAVESGKVRLTDTIAQVFDLLVEQGSIAPVDAGLAADIFFDVAVGARSFRAAFGHADEALTDTDLAVRIAMFEDGFLRRSA